MIKAAVVSVAILRIATSVSCNNNAGSSLTGYHVAALAGQFARRGDGRDSGFSVCVVYLDPVTIWILKVDLPNSVCSDCDILRLSGEAYIGHTVLFQATERRVKVPGGERHMGGELMGPLRAGVSAD
jgi:hypothetical protein